MPKAHVEERVRCADCETPRCDKCEPDRCPKCYSVHVAGPSRKILVDSKVKEPIRGTLGRAVPAFDKEVV